MSSLLKFAIITGGNSGLGLHLSKALYSAGGFSIILACRNAQKAEYALKEIRKTKIDQEVKDRPRAVQYILLDLTQRETLDSFLQSFTKICPLRNLYLLVNNAGIMNHPYQLTLNNVEIHFDSNYLGHFLLTERLIPLMASKGRILNITSGYYQKCTGIPLEEELTAKNPINKRSPNEYYAISKLANLLHTLIINKRIQEKNLDIKIVAIRPGFIRGTGLGRETNWILQWLALPIIYLFSNNLDYGIATMLHCINCDYDILSSGKLYEEVDKIAINIKSDLINIENAESLIKLSEKLCKISK